MVAGLRIRIENGIGRSNNLIEEEQEATNSHHFDTNGGKHFGDLWRILEIVITHHEQIGLATDGGFDHDIVIWIAAKL